MQRGQGSEEDLYIAHLQVTDVHAQLTNQRQVASGVLANPVWSPDSASLAYIALSNDEFQLWSTPIQRAADGSESFGQSHQITHGPSIDATSRPVFMTAQRAAEIRQRLNQ